jgi:beta-glucosidase
VNQAGIDHYSVVIDSLLSAEIEPMVTLYHQDLPLDLARRGGWNNPDSPQWFAEYARTVFAAYGDRVPTWITVNEPCVETMAIDSIVNGLMQPGEDVPAAALAEQAVTRTTCCWRTVRQCRSFATWGYPGESA